MRQSLRLSMLGVALSSGLAAFAGPPQSDLDQLMARVLARRDENWKKVQQYVLDEREDVAMLGPAGARLWGGRREYTWFIRDGVFVRSPTRANGVTISDADRRTYEDAFARQARERENRSRRSAENAAATASAPAPDAVGEPSEPPPTSEALLTAMRQPGFIDRAYFLRFRFEGGRYAFVGREPLAGRDTLRIEYFPAKLFSHEQDDQDRRRRERRRDRNEDVEAAVETMMNKVSLVTIWVDAASEQIVKYTFDNVDLDFLPIAWLMRISDMKAEMAMSQPFAGVWLPASVDMHIGAMMAVGAVDLRYRVEYVNYREATTGGRMIGVSAP